MGLDGSRPLTTTLKISTCVAALMGAQPLTAQAAPIAPPLLAATSVVADQATAPTGTGTEATPAQAQDAAPSDGLRDIIVTAQRRSENLQKAAVAVDVVDAAELTRSGLTSSTQLGQIVPSLSVQPNGGANTIFFLRGVGNFTINGYSDPAIAFNYDGVYVGRPTATSSYFFDVERIEVLKGPQGTIYGRNATAGAINVIPARPVPGEWSGFASASYGNYNAYDFQGAINAPLGADGAIRFSTSIHGHDGYLSDGSSDDRGQSFRLQMLAHLTPDLTVRVSGDYSHIGGLGTGASYAFLLVPNAAGGYDQVPSGLDRSIGLLDPRAQTFRTTRIYTPTSGRFLDPLFNDNLFPGSQLFLDNNYYGANAEVTWKTGIGTFTVIPGFRANKLRNTYDATGSNQYVQENDAQYSVEARLAGNRIAIFDYILGAYFFDEQVKGNYTFGQDAFSSYQDFTTTTRSYAGFTRVTANLSDRLRLVGGLRYTRDNKRLDGGSEGITIICRNPASPRPACPNATLLPLTDTIAQLPFAVPVRGGPPVPHDGGSIVARGPVAINQGQSVGKLTYRAAAELDLAPRSLLYASYETGYRSGGFSLALGRETFQPEYISAYTIGSKNRFFDNRVQLNIEAFLWKYRNQQVTHSGLDINGQNAVFTENIGKSTNKGVEVELQVLATKNTLLTTDIQYLDAKFDSFQYTLPRAATPPITGCPYIQNPANLTQNLIDCSGRPGFNSPKWTINLAAQQTIPFDRYKLVGSVNTQYKGERVAGFDYLPFQYVPASWTTGANLSFGAEDDSWSISAYVRNIEDKRIVVSPYVLVQGSAGLYISGAPRTFGVRAAAKF